MGIFDFFKKKNNEDENTPVTEEINETEAAEEASAETAGDDPEEIGADSAVKADSTPGGEEKDMTAESAPAGEPNADGKPEKLTPEQIAERKARQEELTKKRDEDGKVLAYLIDRHHELKSADSFKTVLQSLTSSWLWVPMNMQISKADAMAMEAAKQSGGKARPKDPVRLAPALLKLKDGKLIYSAFSNRDEVPKDLQKKFVWIQVPSGQCARYVVSNGNIEGLVVNPNSKSLLLKRELLEKIVKPLQGAQSAQPQNGQAQDGPELTDGPDTTGYTS